MQWFSGPVASEADGVANETKYLRDVEVYWSLHASSESWVATRSPFSDWLGALIWSFHDALNLSSTGDAVGRGFEAEFLQTCTIVWLSWSIGASATLLASNIAVACGSVGIVRNCAGFWVDVTQILVNQSFSEIVACRIDATTTWGLARTWRSLEVLAEINSRWLFDTMNSICSGMAAWEVGSETCENCFVVLSSQSGSFVVPQHALGNISGQKNRVHKIQGSCRGVLWYISLLMSFRELSCRSSSCLWPA